MNMAVPGPILLHATCSLLISLHITVFPTCNVNKYRHVDDSTANGNVKMIESAIDSTENDSSKGGHELFEEKDPRNRVVVALDGSGNYKSIREAVNAAVRWNGRGRFEIYVKRGEYHEYVHIPPGLQDIRMVGDGIGKTVIIGNKYFGQPGVNTSSSATFVVEGSGFIAKGITIRNTAGPVSQAVALRSHSDRSVFYKCSFEGHQDTIYLFPGRQFFRDCVIYGSMDMICGDSTAVFQNCSIFLRKHKGNEVVVTAQKRSQQDNSGFVIQKSRVIRTGELSGEKVFLGRPWGKFSRTVFMQTNLDRIYPKGWTVMGENKGGDLVYYAEFENTGPGASTSGRINWKGVRSISRDEASEFTVRRFLEGESWLGGKGVPYDLDL